MKRHQFTEKFYWRCSFLIVLLIFSTLFIGNPLVTWWSHQGSHALVFLTGMLLVGAAILMGALHWEAHCELWAVRLGLTAVFVLFFLRLSLPERSHVMEYSVLTYCLFQALILRYRNRLSLLHFYLITAVLATGIGLLDEGIQNLLPNRVGSWEDVIFDIGAVLFCLFSLSLLGYFKRKFKS